MMEQFLGKEHAPVYEASIGCISVNIYNAISHRNPFTAKTVPLLL